MQGVGCADMGLQLDGEVTEDLREALMRLLSRHSIENSEADRTLPTV